MYYYAMNEGYSHQIETSLLIQTVNQLNGFLQDLSEMFHECVNKSQAMGLKRNHRVKDNLMLTKKIPDAASGLKTKLAY